MKYVKNITVPLNMNEYKFSIVSYVLCNISTQNIYCLLMLYILDAQYND